MKKILIIGCSGSGKSTLALKLGKKLNIKIYHLDKVWWYGNWENIGKEEFKQKLYNIINEESWIIDGNYSATLNYRLEYCDTVVFLDYSTLFCLINVIKRYFQNIGKVRDDMGGNCVEKIDWKFVKFVLRFNGNNRKKIYESLENKDKKIYIFRSRKELNEWFDKL